MRGNDRVRHCPKCNLNVYNIAGMSSAEVEHLVRNHEGLLCGRLYRRSDGTTLTKNCPVGFRAAVRRISRIAGAALSAVMGTTLAVAQNTSQTEPHLVRIAPSKGRLSVLVVDPSGALISNASVSLVNKISGSKIVGRTDKTGRFQFSDLRAGSYALEAESAGFQAGRMPVSVSGSEIHDVQLTLEIGDVEMGAIVLVDGVMIESVPLSESLSRTLNHIDDPLE